MRLKPKWGHRPNPYRKLTHKEELVRSCDSAIGLIKLISDSAKQNCPTTPEQSKEYRLALRGKMKYVYAGLLWLEKYGKPSKGSK